MLCKSVSSIFVVENGKAVLKTVVAGRILGWQSWNLGGLSDGDR
jgi:hypothetical protein